MTALLVIIALLAPGGTQPAPANANAVLAEVQKFYVGAKQLTASFTQQVTNATFGTNTNSQGTLSLARPDKMHWDYQRPKHGKVSVHKSFISDGATLWIIEPSNLKIIKASVAGSVLPVAVSFLTGAGNLGAELNVRLDTSGTYGATVLEMTPKQPSAQFKQLFLVADPSTGSVTASIVVAPSGDLNEFRFTNVSTTTAVAPGTFQVDLKNYPNYKLEIIASPPAPTKPAPMPASKNAPTKPARTKPAPTK